jgi:hypothetical protein
MHCSERVRTNSNNLRQQATHSYLLHLPRQLAAPLLLLLGPVGFCELQPLDMEGAPVVEIVAVPQLAPRATAPLKRQRSACTVAAAGSRRRIGLGSRPKRSQPHSWASASICLALRKVTDGELPGSPWLPPQPQV